MTTPTLSSSLKPSRRSSRKRLGVHETRRFVDEVFGEELHAQRVLSLANGVIGALHAAYLAVHAIGKAYAAVAKTTAKSGIKQVDRLLSNGGMVLDVLLEQWVRFIVGDAPSVVIALDWTDFEPDDHVTLCAYMVTRQGRATPLAWKSVRKSTLKDRQTDVEFEFVDRLHSWMPEGVEVRVLADRGFGSRHLYAFLDSIGWRFAIRFRERILVEVDGERRSAIDWVPANGRATMLKQARITGRNATVPAVVVVKRAGMKEAWCIATNLVDLTASDVVALYGRRFTIEETFRDTKDLHFGMGLSATHIHGTDRRDRLLLLVAVAHTLLTLLGAASEASGLDRYLKANTSKKRTLSLYRQGLYWYHVLPTMRDEWFERIITAFDRIVAEHRYVSTFLGVK
jgi:hypothetical protein